MANLRLFSRRLPESKNEYILKRIIYPYNMGWLVDIDYLIKEQRILSRC